MSGLCAGSRTTAIGSEWFFCHVDETVAQSPYHGVACLADRLGVHGIARHDDARLSLGRDKVPIDDYPVAMQLGAADGETPHRQFTGVAPTQVAVPTGVAGSKDSSTAIEREAQPACIKSPVSGPTSGNTTWPLRSRPKTSASRRIARIFPVDADGALEDWRWTIPGEASACLRAPGEVG